MIHSGQVYKFTGLYGHIRPNTWGQTRQDVLFKKQENNLIIGDRVEYEQVEINGRKYAQDIQKNIT